MHNITNVIQQPSAYNLRTPQANGCLVNTCTVAAAAMAQAAMSSVLLGLYTFAEETTRGSIRPDGENVGICARLVSSV